MKLVQATCDCGYQTHKARSGYHFHQWWFPVFSHATAKLSDVELKLPEEDRMRILEFEQELYHEFSDHSWETKQEISQKSDEFTQSIHQAFLRSELEEYQPSSFDSAEATFDPRCGDVFTCPGCRKNSLQLRQVEVWAYCHRDCKHRYRWNDSETDGCPKCEYRPHRFKIVAPDASNMTSPTFGRCACDSITESESSSDGYCPRCGCLPKTYQVNQKHFCGRHHERMLPYQMPAKYYFIDSPQSDVERLLANAKLFGEAISPEEGVPSWFCPSCETDFRRWRKENADEE